MFTCLKWSWTLLIHLLLRYWYWNKLWSVYLFKMILKYIYTFALLNIDIETNYEVFTRVKWSWTLFIHLLLRYWYWNELWSVYLFKMILNIYLYFYSINIDIETNYEVFTRVKWSWTLFIHLLLRYWYWNELWSVYLFKMILNFIYTFALKILILKRIMKCLPV